MGKWLFLIKEHIPKRITSETRSWQKLAYFASQSITISPFSVVSQCMVLHSIHPSPCVSFFGICVSHYSLPEVSNVSIPSLLARRTRAVSDLR